MRFHRILILGTDEVTRRALCVAARRLGLTVVDLGDGPDALAHHDVERTGVLLLVLAHEAQEGADLVDRLVEEHPALACALVCAEPGPRGVRRALRAGALDVMPLPHRLEELTLALERLAHLAELRTEGVSLSEDLAPRLANRRIADIERVAILATLKSTGGNKTEAARRLGITARTVSNKLKMWRSAGLVA